jgi:hypothetical protein
MKEAITWQKQKQKIYVVQMSQSHNRTDMFTLIET